MRDYFDDDKPGKKPRIKRKIVRKLSFDLKKEKLRKKKNARERRELLEKIKKPDVEALKKFNKYQINTLKKLIMYFNDKTELMELVEQSTTESQINSHLREHIDPILIAQHVLIPEDMRIEMKSESIHAKPYPPNGKTSKYD